MLPAIAFPLLALLALAGLCAVALDDVPRITGTTALILTIAALGASLYR